MNYKGEILRPLTYTVSGRSHQGQATIVVSTAPSTAEEDKSIVTLENEMAVTDNVIVIAAVLLLLRLHS